MTNILQAASGQLSDVRAVVPGDGNMYDGAGAETNLYNNSSGDGNSTTYLKTNLGSLSSAEVSVVVNDMTADVGTVDAGVLVGEARPAEPSDFFEAAAYVDGTVIFTLLDGADGTEIGADTSLDANNLEFEVEASHT